MNAMLGIATQVEAMSEMSDAACSKVAIFETHDLPYEHGTGDQGQVGVRGASSYTSFFADLRVVLSTILWSSL